jgi:hypothetical protein
VYRLPVYGAWCNSCSIPEDTGAERHPWTSGDPIPDPPLAPIHGPPEADRTPLPTPRPQPDQPPLELALAAGTEHRGAAFPPTVSTLMTEEARSKQKRESHESQRRTRGRRSV